MHIEHADDDGPVRSGQYLVASVAITALIIDGLDIQLLALVAPMILVDWNIDRASFGPALAAALVGMAIGSGAGGRLGDMFGRKTMLTLATLAFGTATLAAGFSNGVVAMTVLRFLSGLGFGAAGPNAVALAIEWLPRRARSGAIGLLSVGTPLGGIVGAGAALLLLPLVGWRGAFVACGLVSIALGLVMLAMLPESPAYLRAVGKDAQARRLLDRLLGAEGELPQDAPPAMSGAARGIYPWDKRLLFGSSVAVFGFLFVAYGFAIWMPVALTMLGFTLAFAVQTSLAFNLTGVGASLVATLLINRLGSRAILASCAIGGLVALAVLVQALAVSSGTPSSAVRIAIIAATGAVGAAASAGVASVYALMAFAYPPERRSSGLGIAMMAGRLGGIATSLSGGLLLSLQGDDPIVFFGVLGAFMLLALAGISANRRHIPATRAT